MPSTGTASAAMWTLRAEGRLFHSGLPHKGINSQEFVNEAVAYLQKRFYEDFPPVRMEGNYGGAMGMLPWEGLPWGCCHGNLSLLIWFWILRENKIQGMAWVLVTCGCACMYLTSSAMGTWVVYLHTHAHMNS